MAQVTFRHRLEAALLRALLAVARALGPVRASNFGGTLARTIGPLLPVSRIAEANLRRAMPELDAARRRQIIRAVWDNLGRTIAELPHLPALKPTETGPGWEIVGEAHALALATRGGPAILFSGHIANWEILTPAASALGVKLATIYRAAGNPLVNQIVRDLRRTALGTELPNFPKGAAGAKAAFVHLARGGRLALLMDQKLDDGIEARFFGQQAMTAPALAMLALRFRCPVIPAHAERLGPARFRLIAEPPLDLPDTGDRATDIATLTQAVNDTLERWIRARPGEWLWLHRRWGR